MTREAFEADLALGGERDFSRNHLQIGRSVDQAWEEDGQPIATVASELADVAARAGVLVCQTGSLEGLARLFRSRAVVTLVAHWRAATVRRSDFLAEPALLAQRVLDGRDPASSALRDRLGAQRLSAALAGDDFATRASAVADLLSEVVNSDEPLPGCAGPGVELVYRPWLRLRHRQFLDEAFPDILRAGNRVELRDGLHSAETIARQIPADWSGLIDLAMCTSASAAKIVKAGCKTRLVFSSNNEVLPQIRLRILRELYRRLAAEPSNYATELFKIVRALRDLSGLLRGAIASGQLEDT